MFYRHQICQGFINFEELKIEVNYLSIKWKYTNKHNAKY